MKHEEDHIQEVCVNWFRLRYREPKYLIYAIPNGGNRNLREAARLKKTGVRNGVADLQVLAKNKTFYIEMKTETGKQSPEQKEFEKIVVDLGFNYYLCRSFDDFSKVCRLELGE